MITSPRLHRSRRTGPRHRSARARCARTVRRRPLPTRQPIAATPVDTVPPCGPPSRRLQPADLTRGPYAPRAPGSRGLWRRVGRPIHPRPGSPHRLRTCPAQIRPSPDRARVRPTAQASPPDSGPPVHRDSRRAYTLCNAGPGYEPRRRGAHRLRRARGPRYKG
jgi:hypothetical protein